LTSEFELGDFEESDIPHVAELFNDYQESYDYFMEIFQPALENIVFGSLTSINQYDDLVEAIKSGQSALRFGSVLETMKPTSQFLQDRSELVGRLRHMIYVKNTLDDSPELMDFNPDKYPESDGYDRGF